MTKQSLVLQVNIEIASSEHNHFETFRQVRNDGKFHFVMFPQPFTLL